MSELEQSDYTHEEALEIASLWSHGKMIGGDAYEVSLALYAEIALLREALHKLTAENTARGSELIKIRMALGFMVHSIKENFPELGPKP
jgi:hypothetical protein